IVLPSGTEPSASVLDSFVGDDPSRDDFTSDFVAQLWQVVCLLGQFWLFALDALECLRQQVFELRRQVERWGALHKRAVQSEADLKDQVQHLQGEIRELERRLYGRKSETSAATKPKTKSPPKSAKPRPRGQQPGSKGHGRRSHDHLPVTHENCTLPDDRKC